MRQVNMIPPYNSMDLSVQVGSTAPDQKIMEWELWGDEHTIELFEVSIRFDGTNLGMIYQFTLDFLFFFNIIIVSGLSSALICLQECSLPLVDMTFACSPPTYSFLADPVSAPKRNTGEKGKIMLVTSTINFHNCTFSIQRQCISTCNSVLDSESPTSTLSIYSITSRPTLNNPRNIWVNRVFPPAFDADIYYIYS